jgi:hypothetical protein
VSLVCGKRALLLLDDVVNDIRKNKGVDKALAKLVYNRRHTTTDGDDEANGVSVWLTTQAYNRTPLMIRKVAGKHKAHHSDKHLKSMRTSMLKGSTFEEAHKKAMKSVGK